MIKELMHAPIFLAGKSDVAATDDLRMSQDLLDTLMAYKENCVGMAAVITTLQPYNQFQFICSCKSF